MGNSTVAITFLIILVIALASALGVLSYYYKHKTCPALNASSVPAGTTLNPPSIAIQTPNWVFGMKNEGSLYTAKIKRDYTTNVQSLTTVTETTPQGVKAVFDERGQLALYDYNNKLVWSSPSPLRSDGSTVGHTLSMDDSNGNLNVLQNGALIRTIDLGVPPKVIPALGA